MMSVLPVARTGDWCSCSDDLRDRLVSLCSELEHWTEHHHQPEFGYITLRTDYFQGEADMARRCLALIHEAMAK